MEEELDFPSLLSEDLARDYIRAIKEEDANKEILINMIEFLPALGSFRISYVYGGTGNADYIYVPLFSIMGFIYHRTKNQTYR